MGKVISTIIIGFIVGLLARALYPGTQHLHFIGTVLLGIGGSFVGGYVPRLFDGAAAARPFTPAGFVGSVLGALLLIFCGHALRFML